MLLVMNNKPALSVIIPVYKVEKYLRQCLDSILSQTFVDFELILVDDGSPDNSGKICDEYALIDNRIKVFHKGNSGVSSARNLGLLYSRGEWIFFSDSDDYLAKDCFERLLNGVDDSIDLVESGYCETFDDHIESLELTTVPTSLSSKEFISLFYFENNNLLPGYHGYPWNKIFRKRVIEENGLKFNKDISFKEDSLFITQFVCSMTGYVTIVPGVIYNHIYRDSGSMIRYKSFSQLTISRVDAVIET